VILIKELVDGIPDGSFIDFKPNVEVL